MELCTLRGYVAGLIDGEASFSISIKKQYDLRCGVRLDPVFSITQGMEEPLRLLQTYFGCGRIIPKPGQPHLKMYIVDNIGELSGCLLPKLDSLPLVVKKHSYQVFAEIVIELATNWHRPVDCCVIRRLVQKTYQLSIHSSKSMRRTSLHKVLALIPCLETEPPGDR